MLLNTFYLLYNVHTYTCIYNVCVVFTGTKQVYCHLNYLFLGLMVEELTGMSYMDFITDMFHCLGVGPLEEVDYTQDLQREDIYLDGHQNIDVCVHVYLIT